MQRLRWTSCCFAAVILAAYHTRNVTYHLTFLAVTMLSLLRWGGTAPRLLCQLDTAAAHWAFVLALLQTPTIWERAWPLLGFPIAVAVLWCLELSRPAHQPLIHAALHVLAALGSALYVLTLDHL
jgi:hypothetical protein